MDYNKVIYLLKTTRITNKWLENISTIYDYIQKSIIQHLNYKETVKYQLPITRRSGGLSLRNPRYYYQATKITALSGKVDKIRQNFRFNIVYSVMNDEEKCDVT